MAEQHARRLQSLGVDLETIRLWLISCTKRRERDEIIAALPAPDVAAA